MERITIYDFKYFFDNIDSRNDRENYNIIERDASYYGGTLIEADIGYVVKVLSKELVDQALLNEKEFGMDFHPYHLVVDYTPDSKTESGNEYDFVIYDCEYPE